MSREALHLGTRDHRGIAEEAAFVGLLLCCEPDERIAELSARARTEAARTVASGRAPAGGERLETFSVVYRALRAEAAAIAPSRERIERGARWQRAVRALASLRHRQRAAVSLHHVFGLSVDDTARVLGVKPPECARVIASGAAAMVRALGEPTDVARALRAARPHLAGRQTSEETPDRVVSLPRAVVRALLEPPPAIPPAMQPAMEPPAAPPSEPPAALRGSGPRPLPTPQASPVEALLARAELEGPDIAPPVPPPAVPSLPDIVPDRSNPRGSGRWIVAIAAAMLVLAALSPAHGRRAEAHPSASVAQPAPSDVSSPQPNAGSIPAAVPAVAFVERGASLWRLAERTLGDGRRWKEIWLLNQGTLMLQGERFRSPDLIKPGWKLRLPRGAPRD